MSLTVHPSTFTKTTSYMIEGLTVYQDGIYGYLFFHMRIGNTIHLHRIKYVLRLENQVGDRRRDDDGIEYSDNFDSYERKDKSDNGMNYLAFTHIPQNTPFTFFEPGRLLSEVEKVLTIRLRRFRYYFTPNRRNSKLRRRTKIQRIDKITETDVTTTFSSGNYRR